MWCSHLLVPSVHVAVEAAGQLLCVQAGFCVGVIVPESSEVMWLTWKLPEHRSLPQRQWDWVGEEAVCGFSKTGLIQLWNSIPAYSIGDSIFSKAVCLFQVTSNVKTNYKNASGTWEQCVKSRGAEHRTYTCLKNKQSFVQVPCASWIQVCPVCIIKHSVAQGVMLWFCSNWSVQSTQRWGNMFSAVPRAGLAAEDTK